MEVVSNWVAKRSKMAKRYGEGERERKKCRRRMHKCILGGEDRKNADSRRRRLLRRMATENAKKTAASGHLNRVSIDEGEAERVTAREAALSETLGDDSNPAADAERKRPDEASVEEELDDLLRMDIQNVDLDHGFGAECFRAEAFSW